MLNISSFLQKARSYFTKEKKETLKEDPVNKLALELLYQIFSYLPLKDFVRASEVSKNWHAFINENIHDSRFKRLCLCPKSESVSWKTHYIQLETFKRRITKQNPNPLILKKVSGSPYIKAMGSTSIYQTLLSDLIKVMVLPVSFIMHFLIINLISNQV